MRAIDTQSATGCFAMDDELESGNIFHDQVVAGGGERLGVPYLSVSFHALPSYLGKFDTQTEPDRIRVSPASPGALSCPQSSAEVI